MLPEAMHQPAVGIARRWPVTNERSPARLPQSSLSGFRCREPHSEPLDRCIAYATLHANLANLREQPYW
jgi:hypothetical protein